MAEPQGILVIGELGDGRLDSTTREVLSLASDIARQVGETLAVALAGKGLDKAASEAFGAGVQKAFVVDSPLLSKPQPELYLAAIEAIVRHASPRVVLLGRTDLGRDVGPRLAFRLGVGLAQDCVQVQWDASNKRIVCTRPVFGGNALANVACLGVPQMASIRPRVYAPAAIDTSRRGDVVKVAVKLDAVTAKVRVLERKAAKTEGAPLDQAKVVVAGGRGLGGPEPFRKELKDMADALGGVVGASRAAVDAGWVPPELQIGLTGTTVVPDLYIAVGISGASQHLAGMSGAKAIVAVNKDKEANIFKVARFGVVGDWKKILPAFTQAVRELKE